jgi:hypothetical protein
MVERLPAARVLIVNRIRGEECGGDGMGAWYRMESSAAL